MNGEDVIKALEQGKTLLNYDDGLRITMENDKIHILSASASICIISKTYKAEKNQLWLNDDYAIRLSTHHLIVMPEDD